MIGRLPDFPEEMLFWYAFLLPTERVPAARGLEQEMEIKYKSKKRKFSIILSKEDIKFISKLFMKIGSSMHIMMLIAIAL